MRVQGLVDESQLGGRGGGNAVYRKELMRRRKETRWLRVGGEPGQQVEWL